MINAWWLLLIVPACVVLGLWFAGELQDTISLLAYERGFSPTEISFAEVTR